MTVRTDEPEARFVAGSVFTTEVPRDRRVSAGPAAAVPAPGVPYQVPAKLVLESLRWHQGTRHRPVRGRPRPQRRRGAARRAACRWTAPSSPPPDDPDEFNDHQLVGLRGRVASTATTLGTVARIDHAPASDLIVLDKAGGGTALIPFVSADRADGRPGRRPGRRRPARGPARPVEGPVRVDIVSIFPDYFAPLDLSLIGKARGTGLLDLAVHDLRTWTSDVHRTVDDSPYGGGPGMVMRPEPWARRSTPWPPAPAPLVVPSPVGQAVHPGGRARAGRAGAPDLRLRPVRGHRPAGARRRRDPDAGARGVARRLRALRRRGRGHRDHGGGHPAAARGARQRRLADRGVARGRPAGGARLHQAGRRGAAGRCRRCCAPATTAGSPAGGASSRCCGPRRGGRTCSPPTRRNRSTSGTGRRWTAAGFQIPAPGVAK